MGRAARPPTRDDAADLAWACWSRSARRSRPSSVGSTSTSGSSSSTLVTVMLLGHWLEMRAIGQAQGALAALAELLPDEAERVTSTTASRRSRSTRCASAMSCWCAPGGRVPADGVIVDGEAELDESMITGESRPVREATSATASSPARCRPTRPSGCAIDAVGADTALAGIQRLVEQAQASHSRAQALADRFAALLFYVALAARRDHVHGVDRARRDRPSRRAHRDRAGHRVPACARARDPADHRGVDRHRGAARASS